MANDLQLPTLFEGVNFGFPESIDSTMLSTYGSCPQKFLIEFVLKKVPTGRSIHLHAGGCFASALETFRNSYYRDGLGKEECLERAFAVYIKLWGDFEAPEKEYKDFVNMWAALEAYVTEYPPESDYFQPYIKADGSPAVEFKFAVPLDIPHPDTGNPILFAGRADMLAQNEPSTCFIVDEKTTKALGASWQYQWDMRGQFYGYTWAARKMGYPAGGALVRGIAIQQTQFGFQEKPLFYTSKQLEDWEAMMIRRVNAMVNDYKLAKWWLQEIQHGDGDGDILDFSLQQFHRAFEKSYGEACGSYGGCQFTDLCRNSNPWVHYLQYENRVWDPLAHDPTEKSEDRLSQMGEISFAEFMGMGSE